MLTVLALSAVLAFSDTTPNDTISRVARALRENGGDTTVVERVAAAVHRWASELGVDPALVVGVIAVENRELKARARSPKGATGIMQVMPHWLRTIKACGKNLRTIETNICFGVHVLNIHLQDSKSVRQALLRYSGCVRAPGCHRYPSVVLRFADRVRAMRAADSVAFATSDATPK